MSDARQSPRVPKSQPSRSPTRSRISPTRAAASSSATPGRPLQESVAAFRLPRTTTEQGRTQRRRRQARRLRVEDPPRAPWSSIIGGSSFTPSDTTSQFQQQSAAASPGILKGEKLETKSNLCSADTASRFVHRRLLHSVCSHRKSTGTHYRSTHLDVVLGCKRRNDYEFSWRKCRSVRRSESSLWQK